MAAHAPSVLAAGRAGRAFPFQLGRGEIEAIKWFALVVMLACHVSRYVFGVDDGWLITLGQSCFPLFAVAFAAAIARDTYAKAHRAAFALLPFAIAAQVFCQPLRDSGALNMLFQYLAASAWLAYAPRSVEHLGYWGHRWSVRALALLVGFLSEFSIPGFALIVCLVRYFEGGGNRWLVGVAASVLASGLYGSGFYGGGIALAVVALVVSLGVRMPRCGRLFAWSYVGHWPLLWLWRA